MARRRSRANLIWEMPVDGTTSFKLTPPADELFSVPNNLEGNAEHKSYSKLVVKVVSTSNIKHFMVKTSHPIIHDEASRAQVKITAKGIDGTKYGDIDYCMGASRESIPAVVVEKGLWNTAD